MKNMKDQPEIQQLDKVWKLACDPENRGRGDRWFERVQPDAVDVAVPCVIQEAFPGYHGVAWYWHSFAVACRRQPGYRLLIRFGAVDYLADVWINGTHAGTFEGGETPFAFDITDLVCAEGVNLLAVRVLNPTDTPIDGYTLAQTPHYNKVMKPFPGSSFNSGGILYPVELRSVPAVYLADVFMRPDSKTGAVAASVAVRNRGTAPAKGVLSFTVAIAGGTGDVVRAGELAAEFPPGDSSVELSLTVPQPRLWSIDDPFLYRGTVSVEVPDAGRHQQSVRFGFRDVRVVGGYFHLNGKRIFLKSTHTGNHMPIGQHRAALPDHVRRDMINAKASGFNAVRICVSAGFPEQLDFCDEIGLLIVEESTANWFLGGSAGGYSYGKGLWFEPPFTEKVEERYDHNFSQVIRRDRNHPSIIAWQLLNETEDGPMFERARRFLPALRKLDPTRLVLLSSGRFDGRFSIGSVSNPGSGEWEHVWGVEAPDLPKVEAGLDHPSKEGAGDFHIYPPVPHSDATMAYIRSLGKDTKPVFLSEYGVGNLFDVASEWRHFEQAGARPDLEDAAWVREQAQALYADWKRLGLDDVYPFPEDLLRESQRLGARQRTLGFNLVRSNPKLCGYNVTGMLDHAMCGEGLWKFWRDWKPGTFDAVCDGWSPLRWCLFADPMHAYAGREVTVEAVLASEDALKPGEYPARFRVFGPEGCVWEKKATVVMPDPPELAVPVLRATFVLKGPPGRYVFEANLERGGAATGGALVFHVSNPAGWPKVSGGATLWGIGKSAEEWLVKRGLKCRPFKVGAAPAKEIILVGLPMDAGDVERWKLLKARMKGGASVLFLDAKLFRDNAAAMEWLPLKKKGVCTTVTDHLYHKECVANRHPVFDGLQGPGVMDMDYYGQVIPHEVFIDQDTPGETICAGFNTGYFAVPRGYRASLLIARYRAGQGSFILSSPYILENLDKNPAADRLLLNMIRYSRQRTYAGASNHRDPGTR